MEVTYPAVSQIDAYWEGLRQGRLMPARSEVDPRGMHGALEYAMLMEMVAPGVARIRVSGVHLTDLLGMEVRGMPLTAFFEPKDRPHVAAALNEVSGADGAAPKVVELTLGSPAGIGRPALSAKLYLAPLASERDGRPRILACLQTRGKLGRAPRRFQIEDIHKRRIVASAGPTSVPAPTPADPFAAPAPEFATPAPAAQPSNGFAETASHFEPAPKTKTNAPSAYASDEKKGLEPGSTSERPYLRLVKTDGGSAG